MENLLVLVDTTFESSVCYYLSLIYREKNLQTSNDYRVAYW